MAHKILERKQIKIQPYNFYFIASFPDIGTSSTLGKITSSFFLETGTSPVISIR